MLEEIIEIVSEANEIVGQEKRSAVHQSGQWHRGVHIFLFDASAKLLVQQRSKKRAQFPSTFDCSVSEHLKPGESYLDAARRGMHEELGVAPPELHKLIQFRMNYGPGDNMISEMYTGTIDPGAVKIDLEEVERIAYYSISELETMLDEKESAFSPWFAQLLRWHMGKPSTLVLT